MSANSFSLFTEYVLYKNQGRTEKVPVTIPFDGSDISKVTSISCMDFLIQFLWSEKEKEIDMIGIFSDGRMAQLQLRYDFCLLTELQKDVDVVEYYFDVHHDKGPIHRIGGTIKNILFKNVLPGSTIINISMEFTESANTVVQFLVWTSSCFSSSLTILT